MMSVLRFLIICFIMLGTFIPLFSQIEECNNGIDDDGDGLIDIFDHDCDCRLNLISDSGFNIFEDCCFTLNCLNSTLDSDWSTVDLGGVELYQYDCMYSIYPFTDSGLRDDDNFVAGGVNYFDTGIAGGELPANCLNQAMLSGLSYRFSLEIGGSGVEDLVEDFELILYGVAKCDSLDVFGGFQDIFDDEFCKVTSPKEELARINLFGMQLGWNHFTIDITPTTDIEAIFFSVDCDFVPTVDQYNYVHYDNVVITPVIELPASNTSGNLCADDIIITVEDDLTSSYSWYLDSIEMIGEVSSTLDLSSTGPLGHEQYHVNIVNAAGDCVLVGPIFLPDTVYMTTELIDLCYDDTLIFPDGSISNESSIDTFMMTASNGCDSMAIYDIHYFPELIYSYIINSECNIHSLEFAVNNDIAEIEIDGTSYNPDLPIENLTTGIHELDVTDINGCMYAEEFEIMETPAIAFSILQSAPICPGSMSGFIEIQSLESIHSLILDNEEYEYPIVFDNLYAGEYDLTIIDNDGCTQDIDIVIDELPAPDVFLEDSIYIDIYEDYSLELNGVIPENVVYVWSPAELLSCVDCPNPSFTSTQSSNISLTLTIGDCSQDFYQSIIVDENIDVYIPNVFNPDSKSGNDKFGAFTPLHFETFDMFIYDRWGNLVFNVENADELKYWDGTFKESRVINGVYIYVLKFELSGGNVLNFDGHVSLIR